MNNGFHIMCQECYTKNRNTLVNHSLPIRREFSPVIIPDCTPTNQSLVRCVYYDSKMAPREGFEPPTNSLTVSGSAAELPGNDINAV
jgi:hypothetical protein